MNMYKTPLTMLFLINEPTHLTNLPCYTLNLMLISSLLSMLSVTLAKV